MDRRFRLLVNPTSGGGRAAESAGVAASILGSAGAQVQVVTTQSADHGVQVAGAAARDGEIVVAVGGDGTVAAVAGAVRAAGGTLGILPGGRGNDFARMLGIPETASDAARVLVDAPVRAVDVIAVGDALVLGSVYAGVDSLACVLLEHLRWLPRGAQYPSAAVWALLKNRPADYTVTVDGVEHAVRGHSVIVANSRFYGKGMQIVPAAEIDDGLLDVLLIPDLSRFALVRFMPKVYDGAHVGIDGVRTFRGREIAVAASAPIEAWGDGEPLAPLPVTVRVVPGGLSVLMP